MQHRALRIGFPVIAACWAVSIIVQSRGLRASSSTPTDVGPGFLPLLLAVLLVVLLAAEVALPLIRGGGGRIEGTTATDAPTDSRHWIYLGAVVATAALTYLVGVLLAVAALILCSFKVERRPWLPSLIGTVLLVAVLYFVFATLLHVRIPLLPA